jgi:glycosyltransferase involved in cell wall biosynthesis
VEAMKILIDKGHRLKLLIIGGLTFEYALADFADYPTQIKKLISDLGIENLVQWLGFSNPQEVSKNLLESDICVLPFIDGVNERGSSFNTALSHGLPLVTTLGDYAPSKLIDHENVLLVPPKNPTSLARAILELIVDKNLKEKLIENAKKLYDEEYSWPVIINKTINSYSEAINGVAGQR